MLPGGVAVTPDQMMALLMHSYGDDNMRHIQGGGIEIPDFDLTIKGKYEEAADKTKKIRLTRSAIQDIAKKNLTAKEMEFVEAARNYYKNMSQPEINRTAEKLLGHPLAEVKNYWRIVSSKVWMKGNFDVIKYDGTIEGEGWTKERVQAKGTITLVPFSEQVKKDIEAHGRYVGLAIPISNFSKVYGTKTSTYSDGNMDQMDTSSVQAAIREKWGNGALKYIEKMLADIQNPVSTSDTYGRALSKLRGNYAATTLTLNAGVAIKQAASYPTAAAVLGWRPLRKAFARVYELKKKNSKWIAQYSPLMRLRTEGYSSPDLGDIRDQSSAFAKALQSHALDWINDIDVFTVSLLWIASEEYVKETQPNLAPDSESFYRAVGEVHTDVIKLTQPNYSALQRPQVLRSNDSLTRMLMMFKTQPFQNFNILYEAAGMKAAAQRGIKVAGTMKGEQARALKIYWQKKDKEATTALARAISSQLVAALVFSLMQYGWDLFRHKTDKYEKDGLYYVDLACWCTDLDGNYHTECGITVRLPKKP